MATDETIDQDPRQGRILIVDDEPQILEEYETILAERAPRKAASRLVSRLEAELFGERSGVVQPQGGTGYEIVSCSQGEQAIEEVRKSLDAAKPFAVAFLDVRMPPGLDGVETAARIRALDPRINIVIVTAYSDAHPNDIANHVGAADKLLYCQKPLNAAELIQLARALTARWNTENELFSARERNSLLLEWSPIAIFACDPRANFRLTFVSENVTARLGIPRQDLLDDPEGWTKRVHEEDRRKLHWALRDSAVGKRKKLIYRMQRPGRGYLWLQSELSLVRDAKGAPQEIIGYWLDVSDHKENERKLIAAKLAAQSALVATNA